VASPESGESATLKGKRKAAEYSKTIEMIIILFKYYHYFITVLWLAAAGRAYADGPVLFDPDGDGPLAPVALVGFDVTVGRGLARDLFPLEPGRKFQFYNHGRIISYSNDDGLHLLSEVAIEKRVGMPQ
jgi:hypothetical protein